MDLFAFLPFQDCPGFHPPSLPGQKIHLTLPPISVGRVRIIKKSKLKGEKGGARVPTHARKRRNGFSIAGYLMNGSRIQLIDLMQLSTGILFVGTEQG